MAGTHGMDYVYPDPAYEPGYDTADYFSGKGMTQCSPTTYEAEAMYHSVGGPTPGGWYIWSNGYIESTHDFVTTSGAITVYARGDVAGGVWPRMRVAVNGVEIGVVSVSATSYQPYTFNYSTTTGSKPVRVSFDNDAIIGSEDRNLLVDKVAVGCSSAPVCTPESDAQFCARLARQCGAVSGTDNCGVSRSVASCGSCQSGQSCNTSGQCVAKCSPTTYEAETMYHSVGGPTPGGWYIWSNGYIQSTHNFVTTSGAITVYARGDVAGGVWPRMRVAVNGVEIGVVSVRATSYQPYTFNYSTSTGSKRVRVSFDNDAIIGSEDRNLLVDKVVVGCSSAPVCTPESDAQFCARLARQCGAVSGTDNCGGARRVASCGSCQSGGSCGMDGQCSADLPPGSWELVWRDEFDGPANAPPDGHWFFFKGWGSSTLWRNAWYTREDAFLDGSGNLLMRTRIEAADGYKYKTSYLQTYDFNRPTSEWTTFSPYPTKYIEARVRLDRFVAAGKWCAFWLFDPTDTYDGNPANGTEIDIMEYVLGNNPANRNYFHIANHWGGSVTKYVNAADFGVNISDGDFHTFGLEWSPTILRYYLDGILVYTINQGVATGDGEALILSVEIEDNAWGMGGVLSQHAGELPDYFIVDYVRVYALQ